MLKYVARGKVKEIFTYYDSNCSEFVCSCMQAADKTGIQTNLFDLSCFFLQNIFQCDWWCCCTCKVKEERWRWVSTSFCGGRPSWSFSYPEVIQIIYNYKAVTTVPHMMNCFSIWVSYFLLTGWRQQDV